jgi:tetratricopeptide (TPR) repeat protein
VTPKPRFRVSNRQFFDREDQISAFDLMLADVSGSPYILNYFGVGGIGKSRLLKQLAARVPEPFPKATLDFQLPQLRDQAAALLLLRMQFTSSRVRFDRFDIGLAVLWQKMNPALNLQLHGRQFADGSAILVDVLSTLGGLPLVGTASNLLRAIGRGARKWAHVRSDEVLNQLDDLLIGELVDAVNFLFVRDLMSETNEKPVLFVDSYESLVGGISAGAHRQQREGWFRDLVAQLGSGLVVITGREAIDWQSQGSEWVDSVRSLRLEGLPTWASIALLESQGTDQSLVHKLVEISKGNPFFLSLAADFKGAISELTTREAISERFLLHVDPIHARILELLSLTRMFDRAVFVLLTTQFELPNDRFVWDSILRYSFVEPDRSWHRLHRLMSFTLASRVDKKLKLQVHEALARYWSAISANKAEDLAIREAASFESIFHAVLAGWPGAQLIDAFDEIGHLFGSFGLRRVLAEISEFVSDVESEETLPDFRRMLEVEIELLTGDCDLVLDWTRDAIQGQVVERIGARILLARGHALRIRGLTERALEAYEILWRSDIGHRLFPTERNNAGLWIADIQMAVGNFVAAHQTIDELESVIEANSYRLHRLRHLAHRFAFEFDDADEALSLARVAVKSDMIGESEVMTNQIELLAHTNPETALELFEKIHDFHSEMGSEVELGKLWSARALAELGLGDLESSRASLHKGITHLRRAGYESGLARAELYLSLLAALKSDVPLALASADASIQKLAKAGVYPALIVVAVKLCEMLGQPSLERSRIERDARKSLLFLDPSKTVDERISTTVLGGMNLSSFTALTYPADAVMSGFYNENSRVGDFVIRKGHRGAPEMDLRIWHEADVNLVVARHGIRVPPLIALLRAEAIQIYGLVNGQLLDDFAPKCAALPVTIVGEIASFYEKLRTVPLTELPELPSNWPAEGDSVAFACMLSSFTDGLFRKYSESHGQFFERLQIPKDPVSCLSWSNLSPRPFCLLHSDIHRKNVIIAEDGGLCLLDWELAIWGDPLYDLAVTIHKMKLVDGDRELLIQGWIRASGFSENVIQQDLVRYLEHEVVKSAIVDAVRLLYQYRAANSTKQKSEFVTKLHTKLAAGHEVWGLEVNLTEKDIEDAIRRS